VPKVLTSTARIGVLRDAAIGFHGKIPARGDFVQVGLPRAFTDPWDGWMQRMVAASRAVLGEAWLPAWLEVAVWRFALSPDVCGPGAVIGLWMPSVDRVGRYFPLTLAAVAGDADPCGLLREGGGFLAAAEHAGRAALENDLPPDALAARAAAIEYRQPMQEPIRYSARRMARYGGPKARRLYQPGCSRPEVYRMKTHLSVCWCHAFADSRHSSPSSLGDLRADRARRRV
jgi:type VI secretion system protein ImpM